MLPEPPITYLDDGVNWRLDAEIASPSLGYLLIVPQGRISDLASVPELGWNVVAPFQLSIRAAFVHDEIYRHGGTITVRIQGDAILIDRKHQFTRAEADAFLLDIAKQQNVPLWRRQSAYWAVRLFGGSSWQSKAVPPFTGVRPMKVNLHGVLAFLVTTFGVASSPAVLGVLPPKTAAVVAGLGILYQAFSKPVAQVTPPSSP